MIGEKRAREQIAHASLLFFSSPVVLSVYIGMDRDSRVLKFVWNWRIWLESDERNLFSKLWRLKMLLFNDLVMMFHLLFSSYCFM